MKIWIGTEIQRCTRFGRSLNLWSVCLPASVSDTDTDTVNEQ